VNHLYVGFFHTGAYQDQISGYGGIKHCLIPSPKHVIVEKDPETGKLVDWVYAKEQSAQSMLKILGYLDNLNTIKFLLIERPHFEAFFSLLGHYGLKKPILSYY
jgi:arginine decarboxylase-like protein